MKLLLLPLAIAFIATCSTLVRAGKVSVLVKGGKVKDRDGWPRGESDPVVEVRVPGYAGWMHTTEDEDDNSPAWHETLEFPNTDIPSTFSVELHAFDLDGFLYVNEWGDTDDLGRDTDSFTFDGCDPVSRDHRFDLDGDNKYIDVTINYTPTDLCLSNNGDCGPAQSTSCTCVRDEEVQCQCLDGFKSDTGKDCFPIDPCQTSTFGGCDKQHGVCTYLGPGESKCACKGGYRFASTSDHSNCDPINPCEDVPGRCGENSLCVYDGPDKFHCTCVEGYESANAENTDCRPINPCEKEGYGGCDANTQLCRFMGPNTNECDCKPGFDGADGGSCDVVNPCEDTPTLCGDNSTCIYTGPGTSRCECLPGYHAPHNPNNTDCQPVNPCVTHDGTPTDICGVHSTCSFTGPGQHECTCDDGYESSTGAACTPINPCETDNGGCIFATCVYRGPGQHTCECLPGYDKLSPNSVECTPINPCKEDNGQCGPASTTLCIHTGPEMRNCTCHEGYTSTTGRNCFPINPCVTDNGGCGFENSTRCLFDGPDLASCVCRSGFAGDPPNTPCEPVDPCSIDNVCGANAECTRTGLHTYNCSCIAGHVSDNGGRNCTPSSSFLASTGSMTTTLDPAASQSTATSISAATWGGIAAGAVVLVVIIVVVVLAVRRSHDRKVLDRHASGPSTSVVNPVYQGPPAMAPVQPEYSALDESGRGRSYSAHAADPMVYSHLSRNGSGSGSATIVGVPTYASPTVQLNDESDAYDVPRKEPANAARAGRLAANSGYAEPPPRRLLANTAYEDHTLSRHADA
ncbi:hypothetical protein PTSG_12137 [Salpingoeca rosetta]|uniref:EGF-like domain-containing protein n=1 Tax=Salpingoeca rosetta (strain ATCC 50818 / BSB-021) TaxID=946362 RepID=F2U6S2_SALR5|nr:uncharacterized protein PTSG_12137 [Salpingoeca rosetta]EGD83554.1 hypothetical protein PTSG_12137 [Salpingoeca rosetta]|eukprot:XP_004995058.1 hypothetical protein PTSG_12137 [Salpingoeca rosetta]